MNSLAKFRIAHLATGFMLTLGFTGSAWAEPAWGQNCLSCHGQIEANVINVFGHDTTANPNESATGAPDRGTLPVFQVFCGETRTLHAALTSLATDDAYAVELKRFRFLGVEGNGELDYTGDCDWPEWGENVFYYSDPVTSYCWGTGPTAFEFDLDVAIDADRDYYDLVFAIAGKWAEDAGLFYGETHFYVQVVGTRGDLNCDGGVNLQDLELFVMALFDPAAYLNARPDCDLRLADMNDDGVVNNQDIDGFVDVLLGR